jgi:ABC-type uncharacterized transport system auxiliary subunit
MKARLVAALALLLVGCVAHRPADPERFFVLEPLPASIRYNGPPVMVAPTGAATFYDTTQIVYSDSPGTRSRYRYGFWTEPPQVTLYAHLVSRLEGGGAGPARLLLETQVLELFHDAGAAPGVVRIRVAATLASLPGQAAVAQHIFSRTVTAPSFNAAGAAAAARMALAGVLDDIVAWVQAEAARQGAFPIPTPSARSSS